MPGRLVGELLRTVREGGLRALWLRALDRAAFEARTALSPLRRWRREAERLRAAGGWRSAATVAFRRMRYAAIRKLGLKQSEQALIETSKEYWTDGNRYGVDLEDYSHWLGSGPWRDKNRWLMLGRPHRRMIDRLALLTPGSSPLRRIVEWGCGGGANAVHFVDDVDEYCGIEIAQASLDECARVMHEWGFGGFRPVLIDAESPERAHDLAGGGFDVFLSTYVFELLPGKQYGQRVLATAVRLLRPGGLALVQIRYDDTTDRSRQHHLDYYRHATRFTSYRIDEFWNLAELCGFHPEFVVLVPKRTEEYSGDLYAYFAMIKPPET